MKWDIENTTILTLRVDYGLGNEWNSKQKEQLERKQEEEEAWYIREL